MASDCIEAEGKTNGGGYVSVYTPAHPKCVGAHRLAWERANGPIPPGMSVCHKCDNRKCINVEHLFLGTARDNARDMRAKGRGYTVETRYKPRGEAHCFARLDTDTVRIARMFKECGATYDYLAARLGVHRITVADFCKRRTWKHV